MLLILFTIEFATEDTALAKVAKSRKVIWFIAIKLLKVESVSKFIHPKYYKHLRKGAHQSHLSRPVSGRLACTPSKTEILNKIGI